MTPREKDFRSVLAGFVSGALLTVVLMPSQAWAQDMMGPDWLKLLMALPKLVLYAVGEFALFVAPLCALLAVGVWLDSRNGGPLSRRLPGARTLAALAVFTAIPGLLYWKMAPKTPDPAAAPRVASKPDRKVDPLQPVFGKHWPEKTGYLVAPQGDQSGRGTIVVSGDASFQRHYIKLCMARHPVCPGLRHAFLQKFDSLRFDNLPPGEYEVRYMPIDRPVVGGKSRPIRIQDYREEPHIFSVSDSPVLETPRDPVVGIYLKDF